jgi:hypothetical protein
MLGMHHYLEFSTVMPNNARIDVKVHHQSPLVLLILFISVRSLRSSSLKDFMRRQDELERDKLRIEEQKRLQIAMIEERDRRLVKDRERARLAMQVRDVKANAVDYLIA